MKALLTVLTLLLFILSALSVIFFSTNLIFKESYILFTIFILLLVLSMVWPPDSPWSPWWSTSKEITRLLYTLAKIKKTDVVYELGSGDGVGLITAAREFGIKGVGIEIDPLRFVVSQVRRKYSGVSNRVTFLRRDFFAVDLSPATIVYMYLVPKAINRLREKLLRELKPGTRVICYRYPITYLSKIAENNERKLYLYEIPKRKK